MAPGIYRVAWIPQYEPSRRAARTCATRAPTGIAGQEVIDHDDACRSGEGLLSESDSLRAPTRPRATSILLRALAQRMRIGPGPVRAGASSFQQSDDRDRPCTAARRSRHRMHPGPMVIRFGFARLWWRPAAAATARTPRAGVRPGSNAGRRPAATAPPGCRAAASVARYA